LVPLLVPAVSLAQELQLSGGPVFESQTIPNLGPQLGASIEEMMQPTTGSTACVGSWRAQ
jgi:hypothetical protein